MRKYSAITAAVLFVQGFIALPLTAQEIFNNGNIYVVENGPRRSTFIDFTSPVTITKISTYHWNYGQGSSSTGRISLEDQSGGRYGPWQTYGLPGQGGVPNAYWVAHPNITLPPGRYRVIDSNPRTWAQNAGSYGAGHVIIEGY